MSSHISTGGLSLATWQATNALQPCTLPRAPSPMPLLADLFSAISRDQDACHAHHIVRREGQPDDLGAVKDALVAELGRKIKAKEAVAPLVHHLVAQSFDVLCDAYSLHDGDLREITALCIYLGIMCIPYGDQPKNHPIHYEHTDLNGQMSVRNSSFVLATFPFGTDYDVQGNHPFHQTVYGSERPANALPRSEEGQWTRFGAFVPHGSPVLPGSYEDALKAIKDSAHEDVARLAITPAGIWRVVVHANVRFREQFATFNGDRRRREIASMGRAIAPATIAAIAPQFAPAA